MKRLTTCLLILTLVFTMSITSFASYVTERPWDSPTPSGSTIEELLPSLVNDYHNIVSKYPYILYYSYNGAEDIIFSDTPAKVTEAAILGISDTWLYAPVGSNLAVRKFGSNEAPYTFIETTVTDISNYALRFSKINLICTNHVIYGDNEDIYFGAEHVVSECDGTSCPANDIEHDNICDDCGNVLTFSLRSTLLDYAKNLAETAYPDTHPYYAVVEHPTDENKYFVYVSAALMGSTDQTTVTGGDMRRTVVVTMENGSFGYQGWSAVDSWSGRVVYANQTIPFFFRVPLTVTIQSPTGEQMEMEAPNLTEVFSTLAICGIGCLALLIILRLFRASLTNFLN